MNLVTFLGLLVFRSVHECFDIVSMCRNDLNFRVVLYRIRLFPTLISKIKWLESELALKIKRQRWKLENDKIQNLKRDLYRNFSCSNFWFFFRSSKFNFSHLGNYLWFLIKWTLKFFSFTFHKILKIRPHNSLTWQCQIFCDKSVTNVLP